MHVSAAVEAVFAFIALRSGHRAAPHEELQKASRQTWRRRRTSSTRNGGLIGRLRLALPQHQPRCSRTSLRLRKRPQRRRCSLLARRAKKHVLRSLEDSHTVPAMYDRHRWRLHSPPCNVARPHHRAVVFYHAGPSPLYRCSCAVVQLQLQLTGHNHLMQ